GLQNDAAIEALQEHSHGWAAGLTLLLQRAQRPGDIPAFDAESLQHVFGYFAQRVFDAATRDEQRVLMQLAVLPLITLDVAANLTGSADTAKLLDHYYKHHLFTDRRRVTAPDAAHASTQAVHGEYVFQFHALFRTFLLHRARGAYGEEERH